MQLERAVHQQPISTHQSSDVAHQRSHRFEGWPFRKCGIATQKDNEFTATQQSAVSLPLIQKANDLALDCGQLDARVGPCFLYRVADHNVDSLHYS